MQGTVPCQVSAFSSSSLTQRTITKHLADRRNGQTDLSWSLREKSSVIGGNRIEQMLPIADGSPSYKLKWLSLAETGLGVPDQGVYIVVVTTGTNNRLS